MAKFGTAAALGLTVLMTACSAQGTQTGQTEQPQAEPIVLAENSKIVTFTVSDDSLPAEFLKQEYEKSTNCTFEIVTNENAPAEKYLMSLDGVTTEHDNFDFADAVSRISELCSPN